MVRGGRDDPPVLTLCSRHGPAASQANFRAALMVVAQPSHSPAAAAAGSN